jgi:hypothetical protein
MLTRGKFLLKMLHFDHGYVTCLFVENFSRPSTKYMFFGDVAIHIRLGLAINKIKKTKRKLGFSKTLD